VKKIILLTGAIFIVFFLAEFTISIFKPQITYKKAMEYSNKCFKNDDLLPFTLEKNCTSKMKNIWGDYDTKYTINKQGYRGKDFQLEKEVYKKRILFLGDSFTFGLGVSDEKIFPNLVEEIINKKQLKYDYESINAAYAASFSPDSYYLYFKKRGFTLSPDLIIVAFFVWNDIADLSETDWIKTDNAGLPEKIISSSSVITDGKLVNVNIKPEYKIPYLRDSNLFVLFFQLFKNLFPRRNMIQNDIPKRDLYWGCTMSSACIHMFRPEEEKTYKVIKAMKELADTNSIPIVFVLIPVDYQLYPEAAVKYANLIKMDTKDKQFIQNRLSTKLQEMSIPFLDLYPIFENQKNKGYPYFKNDAHFNETGHQITAEAIADLLERRKLLE